MCNLCVRRPLIYHGFRVSESGIDMLATRSTLRCSAAAGHVLHLNRHLELSFSLLAISLHMSDWSSTCSLPLRSEDFVLCGWSLRGILQGLPTM
jgi:hypothetical protein